MLDPVPILCKVADVEAKTTDSKETLMSRMNDFYLDLADLPLFRETDPDTSRDGAKAVQPRKGSQQYILLKAYAERLRGLTDEEAGDYTGLSANRKCCYWKRCSELRHAGLIADCNVRRNSSAGSPQMVCVITAKVIEALVSCK